MAMHARQQQDCSDTQEMLVSSLAGEYLKHTHELRGTAAPSQRSLSSA